MTTLTLSLTEIANWRKHGTTDSSANCRVSLPALQRGLVWRPKQIELLWDSLMRGIPIGSFVICDHIESQKRGDSEQSPFHLLDGQQRANAIQLGFDGFSCHDQIDNQKKSILWLDIDPEKMLGESSRNFLFRLTTLAHPWGYSKSDSDGVLGAKVIREWLKNKMHLNTSNADYRRLRPEEMQPIEARVPVPMSLLITAYDDEKSAIDRKKLIQSITGCTGSWPGNALQRLQTEDFDLSNISRGIAVVLQSEVLALRAPAELMQPSRQEALYSDRMDITNIEHLFQRLNQQGTRLDGEELVYSLIKAYWPELASNIDNISQNRMPASRLISLAFRVIFTELVNDRARLASGQSVSSIRSLAKDDNKASIRQAIVDFVNSEADDSLAACCQKIDQWLGTAPHTPWGLPPVLRSSIAYNNQDLYLLLLLLSRSTRSPLDEDCGRMLTGVITAAAWFGTDHRQIADILYQALRQGVTCKNLAIGFENAKMYFHPLHSPKELNDFLTIPTHSDLLATWSWWSQVANTDESIQNERQNSWWGFLGAVKDRKEIILYAQRDFIIKRFSDFDPARKDLWESHNRPWDYDHILPFAFTYNKKTNHVYMNFASNGAVA